MHYRNGVALYVERCCKLYYAARCPVDASLPLRAETEGWVRRVLRRFQGPASKLDVFVCCLAAPVTILINEAPSGIWIKHGCESGTVAKRKRWLLFPRRAFT